MQLAGQVMLITGATGGIGTAIAREMARVGATLVLAGRDVEALKKLAAEVNGHPIPGDLLDADSVDRLVGAAEQFAGRVDVLINNAGRGYFGPLAAMPTEQVADLIRLNLTVPILLTRRVLPAMLRQGRGRIVFVGSIAGVVGVPHEAVYAAAKGGLVPFADSLVDELAGTGVGVTMVVPAAVATSFFRKRGLEYDRRVPKMLPPERLAAKIRVAIEADKQRVFVPRWMHLPALLHGSVPGIYRALATRFG
jgi:short-subunit dehydrogenase